MIDYIIKFAQEEFLLMKVKFLNWRLYKSSLI